MNFTLLLQLDFCEQNFTSRCIFFIRLFSLSRKFIEQLRKGLHEIDFSVDNITCQQLKRQIARQTPISVKHLKLSLILFYRAITFVALIMWHYFIHLSFAPLIEKRAHIESEFTHRWMD